MLKSRTLPLALLLLSLIYINGSAQEQSILSYKISARINPQQGLITSTARVSLRVTDTAAFSNKLILDLGSVPNSGEQDTRLKVTRITTEGGEELATTLDSTGSKLTVNLTPKTQTEPKISILVQYTVPLKQSDLKSLGYYLYPSHEDSIHWYPTLTDGKKEIVRFADFDVLLSYPKNFEILTSGRRSSKEATIDNRFNTRFNAEHVEGFALAIGAGYLLQELEQNGMSITAFSPPELAKTMLEIAERTAEAAAWYHKTYGFLPTPNIGILPGSRTASGGFPMPNLFMIHLGTIYPEFIRETTAHELGHYYWSLYVLAAGEERLDWLMLANGIWADHLYLAELSGKTMDSEWRDRDLFNWFELYVAGELANYNQLLDMNPTEADILDYDYNSYVRHAKGAVGVYLMAKLIGKDKFLALQKRILAEYRYRPLSLGDFIKLLKEAGAANASEFFKIWHQTDAHIGYTVGNVERKSDTDKYHYGINITRSGNVPYPLEVEVRSVNGERFRQTISGQQEEEKVEVSFASPLSEILLDPDGTLPMWNSANSDIRGIYIRALIRTGVTESALILAAAYLLKNPKDELTRSIVLDRLTKSGRYLDVLDIMKGRETQSCDSRATCRSMLMLAASLAYLGETNRASTILSVIHDPSKSFGFARPWQQIDEKVDNTKK